MSDRDVGDTLRTELARLSPLNPFEVLGVGLDAGGDAVRAAFLAATKKYHPNRFARESPETIEAANELFLVIRRAYGQLVDDGRRRAWRHKLRAGSGPLAPARGFKPGLEAAPPPITPSATAPVTPVAARSPTTQPPAARPPAPQPTARAPATQPPGARPPAPPPPASGPRAPATQPPASGPRAPATQPPAGPPPPGMAAIRPPARRAGTTPPRGNGAVPATQPPGAPSPAAAATPRARLPVGPPPVSAPSSSPTTGRTSAEVRALLESSRTRAERFDKACKLLRKGGLREARALLTQLAAEDPQSRRYRVKLMLTAGLEHREQGRLDDAIRELERAAVLDPDATDVADWLRRLQGERGRGGLFSKFFGR